MIVITVQRLLLNAIKPTNLNTFHNVGIAVIQTQRNFITVTTTSLTNARKEYKNVFFNNAQYCTKKDFKSIKEIISPLQIKKRPLRKRKLCNDEEDTPVPGVRFFLLI